MSAKERLLTRVGSIIEKTAAAILWKYVDPEGGIFYMDERRLSTTRSPFSGKSFTAKPVRQSLTDVAKELRSGDAKVKSSLWKYTIPEGGSFYCDKRLVGTVKSPVTGKTFPAKPEKFTLSEVGKELKLDKAGPEDEVDTGTTEPEKPKDSKAKTAQGQMVSASEILKMGSEHPAIKVITAQYEKVLSALAGEDPTVVMSKVHPEILELSSTCAVVAKQLEERVGRS
jgi:hypothetical protein